MPCLHALLVLLTAPTAAPSHGGRGWRHLSSSWRRCACSRTYGLRTRRLRRDTHRSAHCSCVAHILGRCMLSGPSSAHDALVASLRASRGVARVVDREACKHATREGEADAVSASFRGDGKHSAHLAPRRAAAEHGRARSSGRLTTIGAHDSSSPVASRYGYGSDMVWYINAQTCSA